uniref:Uncharacterized protein n=1 Tax=Arundo donax TaxID=35708 RepID=A0A0A9I1C1_ARUDO
MLTKQTPSCTHITSRKISPQHESKRGLLTLAPHWGHTWQTAP